MSSAATATRTWKARSWSRPEPRLFAERAQDTTQDRWALFLEEPGAFADCRRAERTAHGLHRRLKNAVAVGRRRLGCRRPGRRPLGSRRGWRRRLRPPPPGPPPRRLGGGG